jgi:mRNA interferase RelE/StbE
MQEIEGGDREWRVRVGDYRIIYTIDDENMHVDITKVGHRSSIYD